MGLNIQSQRLLSEFSTFGIGGPIRFLAEASPPAEEMEEAFQFPQSHSLPRLVIGRGSNCLFQMRASRGLAISNRIDVCEWRGAQVFVGAGYNFSLLGVQSARSNFSGLEFASGIPATVGGAVFMNAGANGKETAEALHSVLYLDGTGERLCVRDLPFGYRESRFKRWKGRFWPRCLSWNRSAGESFAVENRRGAKRTQPLKEKERRLRLSQSAWGSFCRRPDDWCGLRIYSGRR